MKLIVMVTASCQRTATEVTEKPREADKEINDEEPIGLTHTDLIGLNNKDVIGQSSLM